MRNPLNIWWIRVELVRDSPPQGNEIVIFWLFILVVPESETCIAHHFGFNSFSNESLLFGNIEICFAVF